MIKKLLTTLAAIISLSILLVLIFPSKPPKIVETQLPESPIDPQIQLTFSELMDQETVENAFSITPNIPGKISWAGRKFVFTPDSNLDFDQEYTIQINTSATSNRRSNPSQPYIKKFNTSPKSFIFIDTQVPGQLKQYFPATNETRPLTSSDFIVQSYDYDPTLDRVVVLATDKKDFNDNPEPNFQPYTIDLSDSTSNLSPIKYFQNNPDYQIHRIKWLPFESALLVSRTKILTKNGYRFPSLHTEDRELISFNLETQEVNQIRTGNALLYDFFPAPDGRSVLFIDDTGPLVLHNLKSKDEEIIAPEFYDHYGFSEYGNFLLYSVLPGDGVFAWGNNLILQRQDGTKSLLLANEDGIADDPTLSPDESKLAFKFLNQDPSTETVETIQSFILAYQELSSAVGSAENSSDFNYLTFPEDGSIDQPEFSPDGSSISYLNFPAPSEGEGPSTAGYDPFEKTFSGASIQIYDADTGTVSDTQQVGMLIEWVY